MSLLFSALSTGQGLNQAQVDNRIDLLATPKINNTVVVNSEADLPAPILGEINLNNDTAYIIKCGNIFINNKLVLPPLGNVSIIGQGLAVSRIIYTGSDTFLSVAAGQMGRLRLENVQIHNSTGLGTFWNLEGNPTFLPFSEILVSVCGISGFANKGILKNITAWANLAVELFQNGPMIIDNINAWTWTSSISRNFISTGLPHFIVKTFVNQLDLAGVAFFLAKNETAMNVDPAIDSRSNLSFGNTPFNGQITNSIVSTVNLGGGQVRIIVGGGHSYDNNDVVFQELTTTNNYDGAFVISNVVNIDPTFTFGTYDITATFTPGIIQGLTTLLDGATPRVEKFYTPGSIGVITAFTDNGSGFTRITSAGHGRATGDTLFINSPSGDYDRGFFAIVIDVNNFDLLDNLGNPFPIANLDTSGSWDTGSLDQTNNIMSVSNTGGIIPDSQTLGNNILISTENFASTTILTEVTAGTWLSDGTERFKATSDGRLIYTGRSTITVLMSAKVIAVKQSGTASEIFVNIMRKNFGQPSFVEVPNHPSTRGELLSSRVNTFPITATINKIKTGDEIAIGVATSTAFGIDISSIDINIKK